MFKTSIGKNIGSLILYQSLGTIHFREILKVTSMKERKRKKIRELNIERYFQTSTRLKMNIKRSAEFGSTTIDVMIVRITATTR